jgi:haloalkane dehalogenase
MLSVMNMFLKKVVPDSIVRTLSKEEFDKYMEPFPTVKSRKPVRRWPQQIPIDGKPEGVYKIIDAYHQWLQESDVPRRCLYAHPGAIITAKEVAYIKNSFPNTKMVDIGDGIHYLQEDQPHEIGAEIAKWLKEIS